MTRTANSDLHFGMFLYAFMSSLARNGRYETKPSPSRAAAKRTLGPLLTLVLRVARERAVPPPPLPRCNTTRCI